MIITNRKTKIAQTALLLLLLLACTRFSHQNLRRRNTGDYYVNTEITQFALSPLPDWANFSASAKCRRKFPARYMDFSKLRPYLGLSYEEAVQFQITLNKNITQLKGPLPKEGLPFENEEKIFYDVTEGIRAGRRLFRAPDYKKIFFVWVDSALQSKEGEDHLKEFLKKPAMEEAPLVFLSQCLSLDEMEAFLKTNNWDGLVTQFLTYEAFSVYNEKNEILPHFTLRLNEFFRENQELHLYVPKGSSPLEFSGNFQIHYF